MPSTHWINESLEEFKNKINNTNPDGSVDPSVIFFRNFIAGGIAGSVAVTAIAPLERAKLLLQIQNYRDKHAKTHTFYTGPIDVLRRVPQEQGFRSFWRGNLASVLRCFPYYALNFALKDKFRDIFAKGVDKKTNKMRRFIGNVLSGGVAGAAAVTIIYPLDYARTRLAMDMGKSKSTREFRGILHCLVDTVKKDGFYGLYRGFGFSFIGVFIYRAFYFGLYDTAKDLIIPPDTQHHFLLEFLNAEAASTISGFISYPFDTVRRAMMMQSGKAKHKRDYTSSLDCVVQLYRTRGIRGFYFGAWTNALRGTGGAIMLILYDEIHHHFWPKQKSHHQRFSSIMLPPIPWDHDNEDKDFSADFYDFNDLDVNDDTYGNQFQKSHTYDLHDGTKCLRRKRILEVFPEYDPTMDLQSPARTVRKRIDHLPDC